MKTTTKGKIEKTQTPVSRPPTTDCGIARDALMKTGLSFSEVCVVIDISAPNLFSVANAQLLFTDAQRLRAKVLAGMVEA